MMDGIPFPPWWKLRAAERQAKLAVAVERVRAVVRESPDIIGALVFGSYATGTVGPTSDLDLILVTTVDAAGDPGLRHARLAQRLGLAVPCDLLVYECEEYHELVRTRAFLAQARREGIWIDAAASS